MPIAYGDVVTCAINVPGDTDVFTFSGVAGEVIVVNAYNSCFTLMAPGGATQTACGTSTNRNRLDAVLAETGTFTVTTNIGPASIASYSLALERVQPASPRARAIAYGETLQDQINVAGDLDAFTFTGMANDTISVIARFITQLHEPCFELIAPDNSRSSVCAASGFINQLQVKLLQSGTYVVLVAQGLPVFFNGAWSYSLELGCISGACAPLPGSPGGLSGTVSTLTTSLSWTAPTSGGPPTSYVVEGGTTSGATNVLVFDTLSLGTTFVAPGIPNGTYFMRVRAKNAAGTSGPSNEITITGSTGCLLPGAPALSASVAALVVSLQWTVPSGSPTTYVLDAGSSAGATDLASVDIGAVTQFSTSAPPGTYFVRVRARNACGTGPASNEVTLVVGQPCTGPPGVPGNFTASVVAGVVTLSWTAASGQPTSYVLEAGSASTLTDLAVVDVGNQLAISAPAPPGTYFLRVRASNACGTGSASTERTLVVP
jgi:hypothetical protein